MSISKKELLMGRDVSHADEYSQEISDNLDKLLIPLNKFREAYGHPITVSSGWRPPSLNATVKGAAPKSNHQKGLAVDMKDPDGAIDKFCMEKLSLLEELGLYLEHPESTPGWCHLQCVPPKSGNRVFKP